MAYEPTEWEAGMKVTASRLNKIEQGIVDAGSGGTMIVGFYSGTLDKTWQEMCNLIDNGIIPISITSGNITFFTNVFQDTVDGYTTYYVNGFYINSGGNMQTLSCNTDSATGYPANGGK